MSLLLLALLAVFVCATAGSLIVQPPGTSQSVLRVTEGRDLQITCIHHGSGAGELSWLGPAVRQGRARATRRGSNRARLRFSPLIAEDSGTYVCLLANEAATVEIIVHRNPRFLNVSKQQNVTENTTGFILCPVDRGYPEATVAWCKNGRTISSPRINVTHEGLQIANVELGDAANYTCSMCRNGWGCDSVTIAVQVLSGNTGEPPQIAISAPSIINYTESLNLNCTVVAGTAPVSVEWNLPIQQPTNSQSILTLPPGSYSSGEYSCSATSMYGSTSKTVHVNVTVPPLPRSKNWPAQTAHENDTVMLQCQINRPANPAPSYTWRRLPVGGAPTVLVQSQGRFQLTFDHQLRISSVRKEDEGLYECIVENSLGRSEQVVQLRVETPNTSPTPTTGTPSSWPFVEPLRLMTRQCQQQVGKLTRRLTTHLNQLCNCSVTISGVSLSCNEDDMGVYTANVNAPRAQSLIAQLYSDVNAGRLPEFCGTEMCPVEKPGDPGLLAAIIVLGVAICVAVVITVFIVCYCIKQRQSRTDVKDGQSRGPQDTSPQDSPQVYDYPRTHFVGHHA